MSDDLDLHVPGTRLDPPGEDLVTASFLLDRALSDFAADPGNHRRMPFVVFYLTVEDAGLHSYLTFPQEVWEDMGSPDEVTITIEPGDGLNP